MATTMTESRRRKLLVMVGITSLLGVALAATRQQDGPGSVITDVLFVTFALGSLSCVAAFVAWTRLPKK